MNLTAIKAFVYTAKYQGVSRAAAAMKKNRVQVSQWLSGLEEEWNVSLFNRDGNQLTLTAEGRVLLTQCQMLVDGETRLETMIDGINASDRRQFRLGVSYLLPPELISTIVGVLKRSIHKVAVLVLTLRDEEILELYRSGTLDMAVICYMHKYSVEDIADLITDVGEIRSTTVCSAEHALASVDSIKLEELKAYTYIVRSANENVARWEPRGMQDTIEVHDLFLSKELVLDGIGFSALPNWLIADELTRGELVQVKNAHGLLKDRVGVIGGIRQGQEETEIQQLIKTHLATLM